MPSERDDRRAAKGSNWWIVALVLGILTIVVGIPAGVIACILMVPCLGMLGLQGIMLQNLENRQAAAGQAAEKKEPTKKVQLQDVQKFIDANLGPNQQAGDLGPKCAIWAKVKKCVTEKSYTSHKLFSIFGDVEFTDTNTDGGILIGFFAAQDDGRRVCFLQPIYLTPDGEKAGQARGVARNNLQCLKAKEGYAVGGFEGRRGLDIDGLTVKFMKVAGERLNPGDSYTSMNIGGDGGTPFSFASDGPLLIGIHGKTNGHDAFVAAGTVVNMGFLSLP